MKTKMQAKSQLSDVLCIIPAIACSSVSNSAYHSVYRAAEQIQGQNIKDAEIGEMRQGIQKTPT